MNKVVTESESKSVTAHGIFNISGNVPSVSGNVPSVSSNVPTVSGNVPTVSGNTPLMDYDEVLSRMDQMIQGVDEFKEKSIDIEDAAIDMEKATEEVFTGLVNEIDETPIIKQEEIEEIFHEKIIKDIEEKGQAEANKIAESTGKFAEEILSFTKTLEEYDPFLYYEEDEINNSLMKIYENLQNVEAKTNEKNMEYRDYVSEVYEKADENTMNLQNDILEAYEGTTNKINTTMDTVKKEREEVNYQNVELLGAFADKLPYTRLGKVEYTQAYDFMVDPLVSEDKSVEKKKGISSFYEYENIRSVFVVLIALFILEGLFLITNSLIKEGKLNDRNHK